MTKAPRRLDLLGIRCPLNWAHAKALLETLERGALVDLHVDDPRAITDIPRAAEMEGYCTVEVRKAAPGHIIRIEV